MGLPRRLRPHNGRLSGLVQRACCGASSRAWLIRIFAVHRLFNRACVKLRSNPSIPTRGTKVPAGPDWLHEIKHDGYRLIVQRDGARVRLFTRNGNDCTKRYPLIVEAALRKSANLVCHRWRGGAARR
jgi:ATP-dependent DNA ligase